MKSQGKEDAVSLVGSWKQMTQITITYIAIKHIIYILNKFVWNKVRWGLKK